MIGQYFLNITGISASDQQSLIQQPKSILKQPAASDSQQTRFNTGSHVSGSGSHVSMYQGMVSTNTHRSLAESSASGVSQVSDEKIFDCLMMKIICQATLQSYDMSGHYPDLLDIPNRDIQTSPTTTAATSFTQKVKNYFCTIIKIWRLAFKVSDTFVAFKVRIYCR